MDIQMAAMEQALQQTLKRQAGVWDDELQRAMAHSLLGGGKRLRGKLVLLFCEMLGGQEKTAMPLACAIEMIHAHSLIHDDLPCMDNADTRRGKPACHKAYGEATALLAGDALPVLAFQTVAESPLLTAEQKAESLSLLSKGTYGMLTGQMMDKSFEQREITLPELEELQNNKTGALIAAACLLGSVAAGGTETDRQAAEQYGRALGRAFQIVDDLLDVTSTAQDMGKPVGNDSRYQKNTFVSFLGTEEAKKQAKRYTAAACEALSAYGERADQLVDLALSMQERKN